MVNKKVCRLCMMECNKGVRKREEIQEWDEQVNNGDIRHHYLNEHQISTNSVCERCGIEFDSLILDWDGRFDDSRILKLRRVFCPTCSKENPLEKLVFNKKNED